MRACKISADGSARAATVTDRSLPAYDDLPLNETLGMHHAWGVFGEADQLGTINLLTPEAVIVAAKEIKRGEVFNLSLPLNQPRSAHRPPYRHLVFSLDRNTQDDVLDNFYLQGSTQWDALRHVAAREFGYYNSTTPADAGPQGQKLGINLWAEHGIVGRGLLVDVERHVTTQRGVELDPFEGLSVTPELIEEILEAQGSDLNQGDILMLRTGYMKAVLAAPTASRPRSWPGLSPYDDMARFLWNHHVAAVVADNPAVETAPGDPKSFLHRRLIPMLGMALGEYFNLERLSEDCAQDRRYHCFFVGVPLNLPRGVGSPANAIAIK